MSCEQIQLELMDVAARGASPSGTLAEHLAACSACREAWSDVAVAAGALATIPPHRAPAPLAEAVRREIASSLEKPRPAARASLALSFGFGLLSALASLAVLGARIDFGGRPPWAIAAGGVAWATMFVLAFWMLLRPRAREEGLRGLVLNGLGAMAVFMVADQLLPLTKVVQFCYASSWARENLGVLGLQGAFFAVGAAYALVPLFLLSIATGRSYRNGPLKGGIIAGGMFFFLLAPAIFIQCSAFTAGALVAWLGGAVIGSTVGGVAGYWVHRHALGGRA